MQAGAKASNTTTKLVLNYLNIPLFLKVKIGPVFGLVGSGVNFKLSESGDAGSTEKASGVDVPLFLGAGVKIFFLKLKPAMPGDWLIYIIAAASKTNTCRWVQLFLFKH